MTRGRQTGWPVFAGRHPSDSAGGCAAAMEATSILIALYALLLLLGLWREPQLALSEQAGAVLAGATP